MKRFLIMIVCAGLIGCAANTSHEMRISFVPPQFGETRQQLVLASGKPDTIEIYQKPDKTRIEFYVYVIQYQASQEKVPVCLIDNKVAGWGKSFYEDHISTEDTRIK
jgi:hypothetical protein